MFDKGMPPGSEGQLRYHKLYPVNLSKHRQGPRGPAFFVALENFNFHIINIKEYLPSSIIIPK